MTDAIARPRTAVALAWLDELSRERLRSGSLAALRDTTFDAYWDRLGQPLATALGTRQE